MATRNRYAEIMAQYAQTQPFSFTGMPSTYIGGYGGYPSDYTGGFTPYQRPAPRLPVQQDQYAEIIRQLGGGNAGDRSQDGGYARPSTQSLAEALASAGMNYGSGWGALLPGGWFTNLAGEAYREGRLNNAALNGGYTGTYTGGAAFGDRPNNTMTEAQTQAAIAGTGGGPLSGEAFNNSGGGGRGNEGGSSNSNPGDPGRGGGGAHLAKGGPVSMQHLQGPDPAGPDDGYAALKDGEYVINDKAVKKYGIELMEAINSGKISKGKLRGLLEM